MILALFSQIHINLLAKIWYDKVFEIIEETFLPFSGKEKNKNRKKIFCKEENICQPVKQISHL